MDIDVTLPRFPPEGARYMVQRRVVHRLFRLKPTPRTTEILMYVLAYALRECPSVAVHEFVALSNHYHIVLTDGGRELPKFMQHVDSLCARAINASWGMFGTFWEHEQYSTSRCIDDSDLLARCVYVLCNPCQADLVELASEWTGLSSWSLEYGQHIVVSRPNVFFTDRMPARLRLTLTRPAVLSELSDRQLRGAIRRAAVEKARALTRARRKAGRGVLGMARVLRQSHFAKPNSPEKRFARVNRVCARDPATRHAHERRERSLRAMYRVALARFRAGDREVTFPPDTYLMRVRYGCACASP